jgi:L-ascorbate metabolism protein UlaG (beta-lactamase superfamily)
MKVKCLGDACFLTTSRSGPTVNTGPYAVGGGIDYSPVNETADVVVVSHEHGDHNNVSAVQGKPEIVKGKEDVGRVAGSEVELERGSFPTAPEIVLLQPAL